MGHAPGSASPAPGSEAAQPAGRGATTIERVTNPASPAGEAAEPAVAAAALGAAPTRRAVSPRSVLGLQRAVGNRAVSGMMQPAQRVAVTGATVSETLYNQTGAGGKAGAAMYSMSGNYEMTRSGDTGATVQVRVKFLSQARNTVAPGPGSPPGAPRVGQLVGPQTVIPAGDPRIAFVTKAAADAMAHWNGRLVLVGEERNVFSANTAKRLPVTFQEVPVFGLNDPAHTTIIVHPASVVGGSTGNPIDAGNYYEKKNDSVYPAHDDIIYAHEYGHLIGIPDEYSQSNAQLNALLHQAAPGKAASSLAALDRTTVQRMVLAALARPFYAQLQAAMPAITNGLRSQLALVKTKMTAAARAGARTAAVRAELTNALTAVADPKLAASIPEAVAFETTTNFSPKERAGAGVDAGFDAGALKNQISDAYWKALQTPQGDKVTVDGLGDVKVNVQNSVYGAAATGTPQAGAASAEATAMVGPAAPGPVLPALPLTTLAGQIAGIPSTWATAGSALETGVTADAYSTKMAAALKGAAAAAAVAPPPGIAPPPKLARSPELWRRALQLVTNAANDAGQQLSAELITATVNPVLTTSVASLQAAIGTEVNKVMTSSPSALAAGTPDPNMAAMVTAMKARLDAAKAATAGSGRDPLGAGKAAPDQDVTYSYQGLMGSNATAALRADQFDPLVKQFNHRLKTFWEKDFRAEVK